MTKKLKFKIKTENIKIQKLIKTINTKHCRCEGEFKVLYGKMSCIQLRCASLDPCTKGCIVVF